MAKVLIDIPDETLQAVKTYGLFLCPRDDKALVDSIKEGIELSDVVTDEITNGQAVKGLAMIDRLLEIHEGGYSPMQYEAHKKCLFKAMNAVIKLEKITNLLNNNSYEECGHRYSYTYDEGRRVSELRKVIWDGEY